MGLSTDWSPTFANIVYLLASTQATADGASLSAKLQYVSGEDGSLFRDAEETEFVLNAGRRLYNVDVWARVCRDLFERAVRCSSDKTAGVRDCMPELFPSSDSNSKNSNRDTSGLNGFYDETRGKTAFVETLESLPISRRDLNPWVTLTLIAGIATGDPALIERIAPGTVQTPGDLNRAGGDVLTLLLRSAWERLRVRE